MYKDTEAPTDQISPSRPPPDSGAPCQHCSGQLRAFFSCPGPQFIWSMQGIVSPLYLHLHEIAWVREGQGSIDACNAEDGASGPCCGEPGPLSLATGVPCAERLPIQRLAVLERGPGQFRSLLSNGANSSNESLASISEQSSYGQGTRRPSHKREYRAIMVICSVVGARYKYGMASALRAGFGAIGVGNAKGDACDSACNLRSRRRRSPTQRLSFMLPGQAHSRNLGRYHTVPIISVTRVPRSTPLPA